MLKIVNETFQKPWSEIITALHHWQEKSLLPNSNSEQLILYRKCTNFSLQGSTGPREGGRGGVCVCEREREKGVDGGGV